MRFSWLSSPGSQNAFRCGTNADLCAADEISVVEQFTITGQKVCRVCVQDLLPDTVYYYAYTKNGQWSRTFSFRTTADHLTALFVSDAQLGRSGDWRSRDVLLHDTAGWDTTLAQATEQFPDISLCLSAGDQTEKGFSEQQYRLFLAPDTLRSVPIAPVIGNHEFYFPYLFLHFNLPNRFGGSIIHSLADEPYFFVQGNVLFIQLDTNDFLPFDHERVIEHAIRTYPDAQWQVAMMHHSLYSCEDSEQEGPLLRRSLAAILQKYGIDVVLSGHTHRYSRSYPLLDGSAAASGVTYLEGGCCSACNSKASPDAMPSYSAAGYPKRDVPVYTVLEFGDDKIEMTAFAVEEGESVQMDAARIFPSPVSGQECMSGGAKAVQTVFSVFGRAIAALFR